MYLPCLLPWYFVALFKTLPFYAMFSHYTWCTFLIVVDISLVDGGFIVGFWRLMYAYLLPALYFAYCVRRMYLMSRNDLLLFRSRPADSGWHVLLLVINNLFINADIEENIIFATWCWLIMQFLNLLSWPVIFGYNKLSWSNVWYFFFKGYYRHV